MKQLDTEMNRQLNTVLTVSYKHYINTNSRDSTLVLRFLYDVREILYFKYKFVSIYGV